MKVPGYPSLYGSWKPRAETEQSFHRKTYLTKDGQSVPAFLPTCVTRGTMGCFSGRRNPIQEEQLNG